MHIDTLVWTAAGRARQQEKVNLLRKRHLELVRLASETFISVTQPSQDGFSDPCLDRDERSHAKKEYDAAEDLLARIHVADTPRQVTTVQVGHEVRICYLDDCVRKKRGEEESFILGGIGEYDGDSILRTYNCDARLGKAIVRKEVGDEVEVRPEEGEPYHIEIVSIGIPASVKQQKTTTV